MGSEASETPRLFCGEEDLSVKMHRFAHRAMATVFEIVCTHEDPRYAEQAARAAFDLIDGLETELTCYCAGSDISRINRMKPGEVTTVGQGAMECLLLAQHFYSETRGAFDISLGSGLAKIELIPGDSCVRVHTDKIRLDLGGIGKGYAIDRAGDLLFEWEVRQALLHGGFSSVLALDAPQDREGWWLSLSFPTTGSVAPAMARILARHQALSASGMRKQDHIVDPRTGIPVRNRSAVWVSGSLGSLARLFQATKNDGNSGGSTGMIEMGASASAVAEALSTAFMVMSLEEIVDYCQKYSGLDVRVLTSDPSRAPSSPVLVHITR